jgi:hypothetical protein
MKLPGTAGRYWPEYSVARNPATGADVGAGEEVRACTVKLDRAFLRHFDGFPELKFSVARRRRFLSDQLCGNAQRLDFLFDSYYFLLLHSKHFKGISHAGLLSQT